MNDGWVDQEGFWELQCLPMGLNMLSRPGLGPQIAAPRSRQRREADADLGTRARAHAGRRASSGCGWGKPRRLQATSPPSRQAPGRPSAHAGPPEGWALTRFAGTRLLSGKHMSVLRGQAVRVTKPANGPGPPPHAPWARAPSWEDPPPHLWGPGTLPPHQLGGEDHPGRRRRWTMAALSPARERRADGTLLTGDFVSQPAPRMRAAGKGCI